MQLSLKGKNILVTGVSRSKGIGTAIVKKLVENEANVMIHGYTGYDQEMKYIDAEPDYPSQFADELRKKGYSVFQLPSSDLNCSGEAQKVVSAASSCMGYIDGMVLNHAYSTSSLIGEWDYEDIMKHLTVNVAASMMMIQEFHRQMPKGKRGAITLFTSGQYLGPMTDEIAYAVSKEAVIGLCKQASAALAKDNIQVNCVNPGPTDTGYAFGEAYDFLAGRFPSGRWGTAEDAAKLVHFLQSDYSSWITGEVIASEGGFRRDIGW